MSQCDEHNPLKLRHGFGYDVGAEGSTQMEDLSQSKVRKINKMPFKVLDAP